MKRYVRSAINYTFDDVAEKRDAAKLTRNPKLMLQFATDDDGSVRESLGQNENITREACEKMIAYEAKLSPYKSRGIYSLACNKHTPVDILDSLAHDLGLGCYVATNPSASEATLSYLVDIIPSYVARNPKLPASIAEKIAMHSDLRAVRYLLNNDAVPAEIKSLENLAKSSQWEVRAFIGADPNTPLDILNTLSRDPSVKVRTSVAKNLNISEEIANILKNDEAKSVKQAVSQNKNFIDRTALYDIIEHGSDVAVSNIFKDPNTPIDVLVKGIATRHVSNSAKPVVFGRICKYIRQHPEVIEAFRR